MKPIVEGMGLNWDSQNDKFRTNTARWGVAIIAIPSNGGEQQMTCLPLRKLPGWLMTIHPNKVKPEIRETIIAYQNECDDVLWQYWNEGHATNPRFRPEKTRKALPGGLTLEQQDAVKALIKSRVEVLAHDKQAKAAITCWSAIKSKFGVSYKEVPAEHFGDVLSLVARLELEKTDIKALPFHVHYPMETAAPPLGEKGLSHYAFAEETKWTDPEWTLLMQLREAGFNVDGPIYSYQAKIHLVRAMYNGLVDKISHHFHIACTTFPYAPLYIR